MANQSNSSIEKLEREIRKKGEEKNSAAIKKKSAVLDHTFRKKLNPSYKSYSIK